MASMLRFIVLVSALAFVGCAPAIHVVREEAPLVSFKAEQQPVRVIPQTSGFAVFDLANLFTDEHARDQAAADAVAAALKRTGQTTVANGCEGECPNPLSELQVTVTELKLAGVKGQDRTALVRMVISREKESWEIAGTSTQGVDERALVASAMTTAGEVFAARTQPNEKLDVFTLETGAGLDEGNKLMKTPELAAAIDAFRARTQQAPDDAKAQHNLGVALTAQGDFAGAVQAFNRATELDTSSNRANRENVARAAEERMAKSVRVVAWGPGGVPKKPLKIWPEATIPAKAR